MGLRLAVLVAMAVAWLPPASAGAQQWSAPVPVQADRPPGTGADPADAFALTRNGLAIAASVVATGAGDQAVAAWPQDGTMRVALRDGLGWGPAQDLGPGGGSLQMAALGEDGTAAVAFERAGELVVAIRRPGELAFGAPVAVPQRTNGLRAVAAGGGQALLAWVDGPNGLAVTRADAGGATDTTPLAGTGFRWARVGMDAAGDAVVAWSQQLVAGQPEVMHAVVARRGAPWRPVTGIPPAGDRAAGTSGSLTGAFGLAVGQAGDVVLAWPAAGALPGGSEPLPTQIARGTTRDPAFTTTAGERDRPGAVTVAVDVAPDGSAIVAQSMWSGARVRTWQRSGPGAFGPAQDAACDGAPSGAQVADASTGGRVLLSSPAGPFVLDRDPASRRCAPLAAPAPAPPLELIRPGTGGGEGAAALPAVVRVFPRQRLGAVLRAGLRIALRYDPGGRVRVDLVASRATSRRLGLGRRTRMVGTRTVRVAVGEVPVVRVPTAKGRVRNALRQARRLPLQVRLVAAGRTVATQRLTLHR